VSVIWTEGFDMYGAFGNHGLRWQAINAGGSINGSGYETGRFGGAAMRYQTGTGAQAGGRAPFSTAGINTMACGIAFKTNSAVGGDAPFLQILDVNLNVQFTIGYTSGMALKVWSGNSASVLGTSAASILSAGTYTYLEFETSIAASGTFNLYANGASLLTLSGVNTRGVGSGAGNWIYTYSGSGQSPQVVFDDMYICDVATKLGECRIETLVGASDYTTQFTPSSGANNYSRTTTYDGDTSYVQTGGVGNQDWYNPTSLSSIPSAVYAISVVSIAEKTDAGSRYLNNAVLSGGTPGLGSNIALSSGYLRNDNVLNNDPNTAGPWSGSSVNALKFGPKLAA
jgi:hypothetical protein